MRSLNTMMLCTLLIVTACGEAVYDQIELMPPPAVYIKGEVDPFPKIIVDSYADQSRLFYVTDRRPATDEDKPKYYANARGGVLRGGTVDVRADPPFSGWDELRAISVSTKESPRRVLRMSGVNELGVLPIEGTNLGAEQITPEKTAQVGKQFAAQINRKLAGSPQKDIFLYVHGYNVDFEYPVLSSKELQHYLGYRGAFITYAWPATPNRLAYFKDLETADATRRNLREFIKYLSDNTSAQNIHIIGYSAGSRLAFEAVYDLALQYTDGRKGKPKLGKLIMIGSDVDRNYFVQAIDDGLLDVTQSVTVYMSESDAALRMSSLVLGQDRLGQMSLDDQPDAETARRILAWDRLSLIDVTDAEGSTQGNGHAYFRSSPWASSDMFVSLIYGLTPVERGLVVDENQIAWRFPQDYPTRIVRAVSSRQ